MQNTALSSTERSGQCGATRTEYRGHPPRIHQGDFVVSPKDYNLIECIKRKDDAPAGQDKSGSRASLDTAAAAQHSETKHLK